MGLIMWTFSDCDDTVQYCYNWTCSYLRIIMSYLVSSLVNATVIPRYNAPRYNADLAITRLAITRTSL